MIGAIATVLLKLLSGTKALKSKLSKAVKITKFRMFLKGGTNNFRAGCKSSPYL